MDPAAELFKKLRESGWEPSEDKENPDNYPVKIENPVGTLTKEGTRQNGGHCLSILRMIKWKRG